MAVYLTLTASILKLSSVKGMNMYDFHISFMGKKDIQESAKVG